MGMQMRALRAPTSRFRTQDMTFGAADKVGEARRRAMAARDALAGRRAPVPWLWLGAAAAVGAGVFWAIGSAARHALRRVPVDTLVIDDEAAVAAGAPVSMSATKR
jgi:hypothetical protein